MSITRFCLLVVGTLFIASCGGSSGGGGGGGGDSGGSGDAPLGGDGAPPPSTAPQFPGISLAYSPSPEQIVLEWFTAGDDTTPSTSLLYHVYQSTDSTLGDSVIAGTEVPATTLTGETRYVLDGLTPGQQYYLIVIAEDGDGELSDNTRVTELATLDTPIVVAVQPKSPMELGLTVVENGLNDFTVSGTGADAIVVGDVLFLDNTFGRSLRRVISSTVNSNDNHILTERASLADVISDGVLRSSVLLSDGLPAPLPRRIHMSGDDEMETVLRRSNDSGNIHVVSREHGTRPTPKTFGTVDLEQGVTLSYTVGFEAGVEAEARWSQSIVDTPTYVKGVAKGRVFVDAVAAYNITGTVDYEKKVELLSKTMTFTYAAGPVPVVQDVTLQFFGELSFKAEAALDMELKGHAEKSVEIGFEWDEQNGYRLINNEGFENVITFTLEGEASAQGVLKVYPVVTTRFYKAAGASLYVVPQVTLDANARLLPLPAEMTRFDVDFLVQGYASVDLTVFGAELARWESNRYELLKIPIFSLPEVALNASPAPLDTCGTRKILLLLAQGYNNEVAQENISWEVDGGNLNVTNSGNTAEFSADTAGTYTVDVSAYGDGFLGVLGTRYASVELTVDDPPPGDCDPANSEAPGQPIACMPTIFALTGIPMPSKSTMAAGEELVYTFPILCTNGCKATGTFSSPDTDTWSLQFGQYNWDDYDFITLDSTDGDVGSFVPQTLHLKPGYYVPSLHLYQDNLTVYGGSHGTGYDSNNGFEVFGTYQMSAALYDLDDLTQPAEQCEGDSGLPVVGVNVVGPDLDSDGNEEPEDAIEIEINGGQLSSESRRGDEDWYQFTPTVEPYYGAVYDSDDAYDPGCWLIVDSPGEYLSLYGTLESAQARTGLLANGFGKLIYAATPDVKYYLLTGGTSSYTLPVVVGITSDCTDLDAGHPQLTGPPVLSATTITQGDLLTVTLPITTNITRAGASMIPFPTGGNGGGASQSALDGLDTATIVIDTQYTLPGDYTLRISLNGPGTTYVSKYDWNTLYSDTEYIYEITDYAAATVQTSVDQITMPVVTVLAP